MSQQGRPHDDQRDVATRLRLLLEQMSEQMSDEAADNPLTNAINDIDRGRLRLQPEE